MAGREIVRPRELYQPGLNRIETWSSSPTARTGEIGDVTRCAERHSPVGIWMIQGCAASRTHGNRSVALRKAAISRLAPARASESPPIWTPRDEQVRK